MPTLLLRLAAPMQSWGYDCKFEERRTGNEPTKSGVVGMVAAALGIKRDADLSKLNALRFGVRSDREGILLKDFHTAKAKKDSYITYRYYLCDAVFLVGLESDNKTFLEEIESALNAPTFPLFLGRRSCPPTLPLTKKIIDCSLKQALENEPALIKNIKNPVKIQIENQTGTQIKQDLAVSFSPYKRLYGYRKFEEYYINIDTQTQHDAMSELVGD